MLPKSTANTTSMSPQSEAVVLPARADAAGSARAQAGAILVQAHGPWGRASLHRKSGDIWRLTRG
eukprot:CAMPEP_0195059334 /NCGR_PEP_ID=MMETSP0448-20130528/6853_1 /TAXON_ID=66468 /ORGANISM="Heterocapsa triquestra, Strain CCMP 448" /LENGTH=64 /DNA_ID=CAMNT_0040089591 /DNA_START=13 /DNA_END=207 /DNA_ORIENTATION=+